MPHPLVDQLRFARSEFVRSLDGVTDADARRRFDPMNSISWMVGHLADQENRYWVMLGRGVTLLPELNEMVGYGKPASTPPLDAMWQAWHTVTAAADLYLDTLTQDALTTHFHWRGRTWRESIGTMLLRNIYHYWFHCGEAAAVRQLLGQRDLPQFVGDMSSAVYRPEA